MTFQNCRFAYLRRFVFLLQLFQPPLQVSILVLQSHFITSFNAQSLCSFALSALSLPLSLPVEGLGIALCTSSSACVSAKALATDAAFPCLGIFFLFSFFFFSIVRRVFVFARRPLSRRFLDKFATTKNQCLKYGRCQPRLLAWYISALRNV